MIVSKSQINTKWRLAAARVARLARVARRVEGDCSELEGNEERSKGREAAV